MTLDDLWGQWKICVFIMLSFLKGFKRLDVKQYIAEKDDFNLEDDLMWPLKTSGIIIHLIKNLCLHNVGNHRIFFYQNQFINEYATKKKAKIS